MLTTSTKIIPQLRQAQAGKAATTHSGRTGRNSPKDPPRARSYSRNNDEYVNRQQFVLICSEAVAQYVPFVFFPSTLLCI